MINLLKCALIAVVALTVSCAYKLNSPSGGISDPVFPRTPSIIPLATGNAWTFTTTWYDSLGKKLFPAGVDFHIAINTQYGLLDEITLVPLDWNTINMNFSGYVYQYEMEEQGKGYLVIYRDLYPMARRGLYIFGEYRGTTVSLYPKEQLWLAYPADSGRTWTYQIDPLLDTTFTATVEVLSNHARFYMMSDTAMPGLSFSDSCYLYKETQGTTVSYYYYDRNIGNLGYLQYENGVLRKTLLLKSFTNTRYGNYPE